MPDSHVTIIGNVATEPRESEAKNGTAFVTFRLATNSRYYDGRERRWVDGSTSFYTVACWREPFASNVAASIKVGDPVILRGRLQIRLWADDAGVSHQAPEITCFSIGPDLSKGRADFTRTPIERGSDADADHDPTLDHVIAYAEGADPHTGEKQEPEEAVV